MIAILAERGCSQSVRHTVAGLAVSAEAGAALTYHALRRFLDGGDAVREVTMAKLATQRANFDLQDACYGVLADLGDDGAHDLARAARDARSGDGARAPAAREQRGGEDAGEAEGGRAREGEREPDGATGRHGRLTGVRRASIVLTTAGTRHGRWP